MEANGILVLLGLFVLKHWIADFIIPAYRSNSIMRRYGSWLSIEHVLIHCTLTASFLFVFYPWLLVIKVAAIELLFHYHVDYIRHRFGPKDLKSEKFWAWFGTEQLSHYALYLSLVYYLKN